MERHYGVEVRADFVCNFLERIRRIRQLDTSTIVFCVERNTGQEAGTLYSEVAKRKLGLLHLYLDTDKDVGLWTSDVKKKEFLFATRELLKTSAMFLCKEWVSSKPEKSRRELYEQLVRLRELTIQGKFAMSKDRWTWSGKLTHDGKRSDNFNDDLAMSLMQALYLQEQILARCSPIPSRIAGIPQRPPLSRVTQAAKRLRTSAI